MKTASWKKSDLLKLPFIEWGDDPGWWDALLIVPARKMHDSGFAHIAIIGERDGEPGSKILAFPDAIQWPPNPSLIPSLPDYGALNTDAYWPSGVIRLWSREYEFSTSAPLSSVTILIRKT